MRGPTFIANNPSALATTRCALAILMIHFGGSGGVVADEPDQVAIRRGNQNVAVYQAGFQPSPKPDEPWFGRSGFIHPFVTPKGIAVTSGFPVNKLHQHALMFAWTSAQIDDRSVDFWNSAKQQGRIEHAEIISAGENQIITRLIHVDLTGDHPTNAIDERWQIDLVDHDGANVVDLHSTQKCLLDHPLIIKEYHYGGMGIRGPDAWIDSKATLTTNEGLARDQGNHTRPRYVTMTGVIDGKTCGIAAISHPQNFRSPQPVRLHPQSPYFCFAPMVLGQFEIKPNAEYISRFRFIAFDGPPNAKLIDELYEDFVK